MLTLSVIFLLLMVLLISYDLVVTIPFLRTVTASANIPDDNQKLPKAAIIMSLRGADPFLPDCIEGLLNQDYPDYIVCLVIDNRDDPAYTILSDSRFDKYRSRLNIQILEKPLSSCSLKCASQVQAIRSLPKDIEIFAFADADIIPYPRWLLSLVLPLQTKESGAATGNRWYLPDDNPGFGTIVRYVWNSAAMISMYWLRIPWGGSMAIKRVLFDKTDILEHWENALCEDTSLNEYLKKLHLKLAFAPSLIMFNHENCSLASFLTWETRQILNNRLHHPMWFAIVAHAFGMVGIVLLNLIMLVITIIYGDNFAGTLLLSGLVLYSIVITGLLAIMEYRMAMIASKRGIQSNWLNPRTIMLVLVAIPIAHFLHPLIVTRALRATMVEWRGIQYRIVGPGKISMVNYSPFINKDNDKARRESI